MQTKEYMEKINIQQIEKLILLADDILNTLRYSCYAFDENGIMLWNKDKSNDEILEIVKNNVEKNVEINTLISHILRSKYDLSDARYITTMEIYKKIDALETRILGMFRNGTHSDTEYYVDNSISDEYLLELFCMRVRDRMIVFAAQRIHDGKEDENE